MERKTTSVEKKISAKVAKERRARSLSACPKDRLSNTGWTNFYPGYWEALRANLHNPLRALRSFASFA